LAACPVKGPRSLSDIDENGLPVKLLSSGAMRINREEQKAKRFKRKDAKGQERTQRKAFPGFPFWVFLSGLSLPGFSLRSLR